MKIKSVEPTPNPNSMKLNMDESLPEGVKLNYSKDNADAAPLYIKKILETPGVKSVFQVADFISVERNAKADWPAILSSITGVFEQTIAHQGGVAGQAHPTPEKSYGEINVFVQMFRGIPMQIKLLTGADDIRVALPERFKKAAMQAAGDSADFLKERKWEDKGVRYGDVKEIGEEMVQLITAAYDEERLERLVEAAAGQTDPLQAGRRPDVSAAELLGDPDWRKRYAGLEQMVPAPDLIPVLAKLLGDPNTSVRRLATVYLGAIGKLEVLPYLYQALEDPAVAVRRAAGDCLSDLGNPAAISAMTKALKDPSKLVRWRAARFLYEVGDQSAVPALQAAQDDPEFEVSLQVKMALERIEGGEAAKGPVWQQMTKGLEDGRTP